MTRDEFKNHLSKVYDTVVILVAGDHLPSKGEKPEEKAAREKGLKESLTLIDTGFTVFAGIVDAILETRDNSRSESPENPFGADYQNRISKP